MPDPRYVSVNEAARVLGVHRDTIRKWVKNGTLPGKIKRVVRETILVKTSALKSAKIAQCEWCGKKFETSRPSVRRFCSRAHQSAFYRKNVLGQKPRSRK